MKYDLMIKGGLVVDPSQGIHSRKNVLISQHKVAAILDDIPEGEIQEIIDASGHIVTPGLIDMHVHTYRGVSHYGIDADSSCIAKGVTTAVDAGSAGAETFPGFRYYACASCQTRIKAYLNICVLG